MKPDLVQTRAQQVPLSPCAREGNSAALQGPTSSTSSGASAPQNLSQRCKRPPPRTFQSQSTAQRQNNVRREVRWAEKPFPEAVDAHPGKG